MKRHVFLLPVMFLICSIASGQFVDPQNVLIRNVYLVSNVSGEQTAVNVLILDNRLKLVSADEIPPPDGVITVDGRGGFLLGNLKPGETPSFLILDKDPRENFDVLLDTEEYAVFALHDGELRRQNLYEAREEELPAPVATAGNWLAYTPPPMALPLTYGDSSKWNKWETRYVDGIFIAGIVLDRQNWLSQDDENFSQIEEDLNVYDGGEIRGFRIGAAGTINLAKPWFYTVFGATNSFDKGFDTSRDDNFTWFDYRLDIPVRESMTLSVGKQKAPISMERIMSMAFLPMQERTSVSDAMLPSRNFGVVLNGSLSSERISWAGGLFNDFIDTGKSIGQTATQAMGRVTWVPWTSDDESNLLHLGLGVRTSNSKNGAQFLTEPEFNSSPEFVDTGLVDANRVNQVNLESSWRKGPYWVAFEYVDTKVDSTTEGDLGFSGWHITGSWILSGEMRPYYFKSGIFGSVPVAQSVYQGGWGAWELSTRFSSVNLSDKSVDGGEMDIFSIGANWWLTPVFNVNFNYRYVTLDRFGVSSNSSGINGRILLMLE